MYELPTMTGVARCIVDGAAIRGTSAARLITSDGNQVSLTDPTQEKKSASVTARSNVASASAECSSITIAEQRSELFLHHVRHML